MSWELCQRKPALNSKRPEMEKSKKLKVPDFIKFYSKQYAEFRPPKPLEIKKYLKTGDWEEIKVEDFRSFWKKKGKEIYLDFSILSLKIDDEVLALLQFVEEKTWEELRVDLYAVVLDDYEEYLTSEIPELRLIAKAASNLRKGKKNG